MPDTQIFATPERVPPAVLLHIAGLLSGFGTAFLGPSLPAFTTALHLSDRGAGVLLAAQFTGAFLGGWTTRAPLRRCLLRGYIAATAGFGMLTAVVASQASSAPLAWAAGALLVFGFGVGQIITSNNLLASLRWQQHRGAALTLLNFTWSAGALCAPLLLPTLLASDSIFRVFAVLVALFAAGLAATALAPASPEEQRDAASQNAPAGLSRRVFLYFCLLLFLYGGVETSLSGWLTTFDLRYTTSARTFAASTAAFWLSLTGARAVASALLLRLPERPFIRGGLVLAAVTMAALVAFAHSAVLPVLAALIGIALAPWFPLVFSGLVGELPTASQAGRIVAVSGLGAAALPWMVGQISAGTGSLRLALLSPIAATLALFLLSFRRAAAPPGNAVAH